LIVVLHCWHKFHSWTFQDSEEIDDCLKSMVYLVFVSEVCLSAVCRRGHDDLGDHYLDCGDLANALKCYSRARDYCTTARHLVNMCLNVIKVLLS